MRRRNQELVFKFIQMRKREDNDCTSSSENGEKLMDLRYIFKGRSKTTCYI